MLHKGKKKKKKKKKNYPENSTCSTITKLRIITTVSRHLPFFNTEGEGDLSFIGGCLCSGRSTRVQTRVLVLGFLLGWLQNLWE